MSRSGILWVAAGSALWGTDALLRRLLTSSISPIQIVFYEHLLLAVVAVPLLVRYRVELGRLRMREWMAITGVAWAGSATATILFTFAVRGGNPTSAVFVQKLQPLFAILLARVLLREHLPRGFIVVAAAALGGAYLISFGGSALWSPIERLETTSALFAVLAAAGWGSSTVLGRLVSVRVHFYLVTALRVSIALPLLALAALWQGAVIPARSDMPVLILLAFVPGFAALALYYRGLRDTPASYASLAELAFPATAAALNWTFLSVPTTAGQIVGFLVLWGAILILRTRLHQL